MILRKNTVTIYLSFFFFLKIQAKCKIVGMYLLITSVAIWQTNTKKKHLWTQLCGC